MAYGGFQRDRERLDVDPETGEQRVVADDVEVSPLTEHERSPLGQMFAPDMTNIGIYAALAALGADPFVGGGAGSAGRELAVNAMGSNAGYMSPSVASNTISTNAMRGASMLPAGGGGGAVPSVFNEMAKRGGVAMGGAPSAVGLRQPQSVFQNMAKGGLQGADDVASDGIDFGKIMKLMGLQFGMDMLGGLFGGADPNERQSFSGTGPFTDPVQAGDRAGRSTNYALRAFADRAKRPVTGLRGMQSPIAGLQYAPGGQEDLVSMLDKALRSR